MWVNQIVHLAVLKQFKMAIDRPKVRPLFWPSPSFLKLACAGGENGPCGTCFEASDPVPTDRNWPHATANPVGMVISIADYHDPGDVGVWILLKDSSGERK
jgi:hypothetical protein